VTRQLHRSKVRKAPDFLGASSLLCHRTDCLTIALWNCGRGIARGRAFKAVSRAVEKALLGAASIEDAVRNGFMAATAAIATEEEEGKEKDKSERRLKGEEK
jgi:hypothetical protein